MVNYKCQVMRNDMSVKIVKTSFVIDEELIQFCIGKYDCRIVYGSRYHGKSPEEPFRIEVLIEKPRNEGFFSKSDKPFETFMYRNNLYTVDTKDGYTEDEMKLLIKQHFYKRSEKFIRLAKQIELFEEPMGKKEPEGSGTNKGQSKQ
jgi:hypothetical protein